MSASSRTCSVRLAGSNLRRDLATRAGKLFFRFGEDTRTGHPGFEKAGFVLEGVG